MTVWVVLWSEASWHETVSVYPTRGAAEDGCRERVEDATCASCDAVDLVWMLPFEELLVHVQEEHGVTVNLFEAVMQGPFPRESGSIDVAILEAVTAEHDLNRRCRELKRERKATTCENEATHEWCACWHQSRLPEPDWCEACVRRHAVHLQVRAHRALAMAQRRRVALLLKRRANGETEMRRTRKRKPAPLGVRGIVLRDREDGHEQRADGGHRERGGAVHLHRRARRTGE